MLEKSEKYSARFAAIDANSLMHRAYHAFPSTLSTSKGVQTNAVYGFTSMLLSVLDNLDPKYLVCAFDLKAPTFRHDEYEDYKANRKPPDESLIKQFPMAKEILEAFNIPVLQKEGYEADDILGTLSEYAKNGKWSSKNLEMIIVTGDRDLLQLVGDDTKVWLPKGSFKNMKLYDVADVEEYFGFGPEYIVDYKGLKGDSSDNIPGVKGIGKKTATRLIKEFGHVEDIYRDLDKVSECPNLSERVRNLLEEGEEEVDISMRLAEIITKVDVKVSLQDCLLKDFDKKEIVSKFQEFEFRSLMKRLPDSLEEDNGDQMDIFNDNGQSDDCGKLENLDLSEFKSGELGIVYTEDGTVMIGSNDKSEKGYYWGKINFSEEGGLGDKVLELIISGKYERLVFYGWEAFCRDIFQKDLGDGKIKDLITVSREKLFDISLTAYYLSTGRRDYSIKELLFTEAGEVISKNFRNKNSTNSVVKGLFKAADSLKEKLQERLKTIGKVGDKFKYPIDNPVFDVDQSLALASAAMHVNGIGIDIDSLKTKSRDLEKEITEVENNIYEYVGHEFNVSSSQQLSEVLFEELNLTKHKKTKTGYSTDASVLKKLKDEHPCIDEVIKYRELTKLKSTYVDPLIDYAEESRDGRIHSTFLQTSTTTARLSSRDPNLQNIPVRTGLGREIKQMFTAESGKVLVSCDYSQIELRILAHFSKDPTMLEDFKRGADFHSATAARLFDKGEDDISKSDRNVAKTINFGVIYGLSPYGLSESLGIDKSEASEFIESYFEKYPGVKEFLDDIIDETRERGYVESILGRRRFLKGIRSNNNIARSAAEREAVNMPMQSTASEIMRVAMNNIYDWIITTKKDIKLLLQIHDEFVLECNKSDSDFVVEELQDIMENVCELDVPLSTEFVVGKSLK